MNERVHRYLDGEIEREALTLEELQEIAALKDVIRETGEVYRCIEGPDLSARVMTRLPNETTANDVAAASRTTRGLLGGFVQHPLKWLWMPRLIWFRPVYGILSVAAFVTILFVQDIHPLWNTETGRLATKVFVQFRLDAPQASVVRLAGSFSGWKPVYTLQEGTPGVWSIMIPLEPGVHDYAFVVDGREWVADPSAATVDDGFGGVNSRLSVLLPNGNSQL